MIVKNISTQSYELRELDGLIIRSGETTDLSLYAVESCNKCLSLQEGISKGDLILLNILAASTPMARSIQRVKKSGQTDRFAIYREQQKRLVPITPMNKRTHMKEGNQVGKKKVLQPIERPPRHTVQDQMIQQTEDYIDSDEFSVSSYIKKSDGDMGDGLKDLHPGFEIDIRMLQQQNEELIQDIQKGEGEVSYYEDHVRENGIPHIQSNGQTITIAPSRQPGVIETSSYIKDAAVFVDGISRIIPKQEDGRIDKIKEGQCLGTNRFNKPCAKKPVKGYNYCFGHMPNEVKEHYLNNK